MTNKKKLGRPGNSRCVSVTPELRKQPDIDKLGRTLIAVALKLLEEKERKGDDMT